MNSSTNCSTKEDDYGVSDIPTAEIYFNAAFLSVVMVTTTVGNSLALHAFFISSELKQITYYFIASLCISDLLIAFFSISLWIVELLYKWGYECNASLPIGLKVLYQCVDIFGGTWSIMSLAFISIERYVCIKHALHYSRIMTIRRVYISFAFLLLYCSLVTALSIFIKEESHAHALKQFSIAIMAYLLPVFIKVFTYSKIYLEAKRQSKQIEELRRYTQTLNNSDADSTKSMDSLSGSSMRTSSTTADSSVSHRSSTMHNHGTKCNTVKPLDSNACVRFFSCYSHKSESTTCLECDQCNTETRNLCEDSQHIHHNSHDDTTSRVLSSQQDEDTYHHDAIAETEFNDTTDLFRNEHAHTSSCIGDKLVTSLELVAAENGMTDFDRPRRSFSMGDGYRNGVQNLSPMSALDECNPKQRMSEGSHSPIMKKIRSLSKWSPAASPLIIRKCTKKASEQKRNEQKIRRFKKELRAAKVVGLIMGTFLICWTPFSVLIMCYALHVKVMMRSIMIAKLLHYTNSAINPILYVVLNKVYRSAVVKVIKKFKFFSNTW